MDNTGLQALVIEDFSGGMTDFVVGGDLRQNSIIQGFHINENMDLECRPGFRSKYDYRIDSNNTPREIIELDGTFMARAYVKLWELGAVSATDIDITNGTDVFNKSTDDDNVCFSKWNDNVIATEQALGQPIRIWKDNSSAVKAEYLGCPHIALGYLMTLANDIKSKYNSHIGDLAEHSGAGTNTVTAADATELETLLTLTNELLTKYEAHLDNSGIHPGAISDRLEEREIDTIFGALTALADLKIKLNAHDADSTAHTLGGSSHQVTAKSTRGELLSSSGGTGNNYLYALHYKYNYSTAEKTFLERSDVLYLELTDVGAPDANNVTVTLPALSGSMVGYNTADMKVAIYRTFTDGQDFYKLDEVPATDGTYLDSKSDTDIENNAPLYTDGGILADEPPPQAKFSVVVNDTLVLGNIKDGFFAKPNVLQMSKSGGRLYSFPSQFRLEFEGSIQGLGFINTYPIVFLEDKVYRVEGGFDSQGQGYLRKRLISPRVGSINHSSIVNTKRGIFFASSDGFYYTDGFQEKKISPDINDTYRALYEKGDIIGTYDNLKNRVYWACRENVGSTYNDAIFVAHLDFSTPKGGFAFAKWSGGRDTGNFRTSAIYFDNENRQLLRCDDRGYLLYHDRDLLNDSHVNTSKTPDNWDLQTIFYQIDSIAHDFGNPQVRKWVSKINFNAQNPSSISMQIKSSNDNSDVYEDLYPIQVFGNFEWGEPTVLWGDPQILWKYFPVFAEWRWFPATVQQLRCMYKQIRFENAYIEIEVSDDIETASIDAGTRTISLSTVDWSERLVNYYISFETDDYTYQYLITDQNGMDITVDDPTGELVDGSNVAWKISGYKKGEILSLSNYVLNYKTIGMSQDTYQGATS